MFRPAMARVSVLSVSLMLGGCATTPSSVSPVADDAETAREVPEYLNISGHVDVPDTVLLGVSNTVADSNGDYSADVPYGWSGTLRPDKEGYTFKPAGRRYISIKNDSRRQNFVATPIHHTLAGSIGIEGVTLRGLPGTPQTGRDGCYSVDLAYGWSGTVTPQKEGLVFTPESIHYDKMTENRLHEDYQAQAMQHMISGTVGMSGVYMIGLPDRVFTDEKGRYQAMVPHGWSGRVIPKRIDTEFEPILRDYKDVNCEYPFENYRFEVLDSNTEAHYQDLELTLSTVRQLPKTQQRLSISGQFAAQGGFRKDITVEASNGGTQSVTDADGRFALTVPYGWSGELSVRKPGLYIDPSVWQYSHVTQNLRLQIREQIIDVDTSSATTGSPVDIQSPVQESDKINIAEKSREVEPMQWTPHLIFVTEPARETYTELDQDLSVMARLLEKTVYGVSLVHRNPADRIQALFLEDDGVLFTIPIDWRLFDLHSAQTTSPTTSGANEASVWEQTRQEILRPQQVDDVVDRLGRKKTLQFKQQLMEALSYAAHIRHLSDDQWITLFVWSHRPLKRLILRVQKGLVDRYAQGQFTSEEFAERVTSWMY